MSELLCLIPDSYHELLLSKNDDDFDVAISMLLGTKEYTIEFLVQQILTLYTAYGIEKDYGIIFSEINITRHTNRAADKNKWRLILGGSYETFHSDGGVRTFDIDLYMDIHSDITREQRREMYKKQLEND